MLNEIIKQIIATATGAGLAFWSNHILEMRRQDRKDLTAGNTALLILGRQYGDFLIAKKAILEEAESFKSFPSWLRLQPTMFEFNNSLRFDIEALSFLVNTESDVLNAIVDIENEYLETGKMLFEHSKAADERHKVIAEAGLANSEMADLQKLEAAVSDELKGKLKSLYEALVERRLKLHEDKYRRAGEDLRVALCKKFPKAEKRGLIIQFLACTPRN